jgi:hypothetical protein
MQHRIAAHNYYDCFNAIYDWSPNSDCFAAVRVECASSGGESDMGGARGLIVPTV